MALPQSPILPAEICDHILDCLQDHKRALKACSLTCKSFLPRSRYHIFGTINLHEDNYGRFLNLLNAAYHLVSYIRILKLHRTWDANSIRRVPLIAIPIMRQESKEMHWVYHAFFALPVALASVVRFDAEGVTFTEDLVHTLKHQLYNVQDLRLTWCTFDSPHRLFALYSSFLHLANVALSDARIKPAAILTHLQYTRFILERHSKMHTPVVGQTTPPSVVGGDAACGSASTSSRPHMTALQFKSRLPYDVIAPEMLKWLISEGVYKSLEHLEILMVQWIDLPDLQNLLREGGSHLKSLIVGFSAEVRERWNGQQLLLDLKPCAALQTFSIQSLKLAYTNSSSDAQVAVPHAPIGSSQPPMWVSVILDTLSSPALRKVSLRFHSLDRHITEGEHAVNWAQLANTVLSLPSASQSKSVSHAILNSPSYAKLKRDTLADCGGRAVPSECQTRMVLRLELCARESYLKDALPVIERGLSSLQGRVTVKYMCKPFRQRRALL